ncbi:MAG TPA: rhodanese-like domain-containing protein [Thermoanaerobaculia bacterium]|nr:rhodanese-like domain-containing protein [Thermoanaerobaculia bacterium]
MIRRSTLGLAAALVALACSGRNQTGRPVDETQAAPAQATAATASPPPAVASASPAPAASPPEIATNTTAKPEAAPAPPSGAPVPGNVGEIRRITVEEANAIRESGSGVIVDVRDDASYDMGHVAGALHIRLDELAQRLGELPRDKPIVTYCA